MNTNKLTAQLREPGIRQEDGRSLGQGEGQPGRLEGGAWPV
jgi:hypothetical protein